MKFGKKPKLIKKTTCGAHPLQHKLPHAHPPSPPTSADATTLPKLPPSGRAAAAAASGGAKQRRAVDDSRFTALKLPRAALQPHHHSPFQHSILNLKPVTFRSGDEKVPKPSLSTGLAGLAGTRAGDVGSGDAFGLVGHALKGSAGSTVKKSSDDPNEYFKERLLKPLPDFGGNACDPYPSFISSLCLARLIPARKQ